MIENYPYTLNTISGHRAIITNPEKDHFVFEITPSQDKPFFLDWYEPTYTGNDNAKATVGEGTFNQIEHEVLHAFWQLQRF